MGGLTTDDVRRVRPPLWSVKAGTSAAVVALVVAEIAALPGADPMTFARAAVGSTAYLATGLQVTVMGLALMVWLAPRSALAALAVVAPLIPLGDTSLGAAWPVLGLLALATLGWLLWPRWRPVGGPVDRSGVPPEQWPGNVARRGVLVGGAAVAAGVLVLVGALVWHARDAAGTQAFESRAIRTSARAVAPDGDCWVFAIGERTVTRPAPSEVEVTPGMLLGVLVDPDDPDRVAFLAEPEDPSWLVGVAGLAPTLLGAGLGALGFRRRQDALVLGGGPSRRATVRTTDEGHLLLPAGATGGPALLVRRLELAHLPPGHEWRPGQGRLRWDDTDTWPDEDASRRESDKDEDEDAPPPTDPVELASWADQLQDDLDAADLDEEFDDPGPIRLPEQEVTVVGRLVEDDPVALRLDDGRVYLGALAVPWRTPGPGSRRKADRRARSLPDAAPDPDPASAPEPLLPATGLALADWLRARAVLLRWVAVPVALAAGRAGLWLLEGAGWSWWECLRFALVAWTLVGAPVVVSGWLGDAAVCRDRRGFRLLGTWWDEVVGSSRVVSVVAGQRSVGVRLRDPEDALSLDPDAFREDGRPGADRAAALLREWVAQAGPDGRSVRRPTPGLLGALLVLLVWALAAVMALAG